ncbi:MAG: hypothetical protein ACI8QC_003536 [Planctomycetota bacterium]|jgi:hypothetical protein
MWIAAVLGIVEDWAVSSLLFDDPGGTFALVFVFVTTVAFRIKGQRA